MVGSIQLSIFLGLVGFIFAFANIKFYLTTLSVLVVFSIINYWIKINIKEFLKSYFLIYFIVFFAIIVVIFYFSYDIEFYKSPILLTPPKSPQEYIAHNCFKILSFTTFIFLKNTFIMFLCLLQAYFFKCYSTGVKRKKISWLIGFVCNVFILIASAYTVRFGLF
ncbi:hypothetical protein [Campylobacter taeniopygiae]|uniref:Uncharacterized protein n=1 Tax=Campylobacter taeniopygiae TaxID=2510188 RepID=A0ABY2TK39_9BACT|nr:hypothetical protein [Campylobacter taeniopygiae]TKX33248.1 hypothetical protein CQA75_08550 [Campylobacter taeniopygiae]